MFNILLKRKRFVLFFISWILIALGNIPLAAQDASEQFNQFFIKAAGKAMPSVVNIIIYDRKADRQGYTYKKVADGTGTILTQDGLIVTNYHVVSKGNYYQIITYNGRKYEAFAAGDESAVLADIKTDLALLKISNAGGDSFVPIKASVENLREGEWVIAIGNPYGLRQSITSGIVSSTGRDNVGFADIEDFIQSDVSINPGSSGGPLINLKGEMVGINTAIRTVSGGYQGISFAIPVRIVSHVVVELQQYGRVRRGWIGLYVRERPEEGSREPSMVVEISSIIKNSPAGKTGLMEGDIIQEADGVQISSIGRLMTILGEKSVGSSVVLRIARDGRIQEYTLPLREKEVSRRLSDGAREIFQAYGIEIDDNATSNSSVISYVAADSVFPQTAPGDTIVSINKKTVKGLDDLIRVFYNSGKIVDSIEVLRDGVVLEFFVSSARGR